MPSLRVKIVKRRDIKASPSCSAARCSSAPFLVQIRRDRGLAGEFENLAETLAAFVALASI